MCLTGKTKEEKLVTKWLRCKEGLSCFQKSSLNIVSYAGH